MNANARVAGFEPDAQDLDQQWRCVAGELSLDEMLASSGQFASASAQRLRLA